MNPLDRQTVRIALPCPTCIHQGVCSIEEQIEADLVLFIVGIGRPVRLGLTCSLYRDRAKVKGRSATRSATLKRTWAARSAEERERQGRIMRAAQTKPDQTAKADRSDDRG